MNNPRMEPTVLFPVYWPVDADPPAVAGWLLWALKTHVRYVQAVAEIARRNGGGGHLTVALKPDTWKTTVGGKRYAGAIADARWDRTPLELSPGVQHADRLHAGPTQTCFTAQVLVPNGTDTPDKATAVLECDGFHADALRRLEAAGWDETTGVVLAMDGGRAA